MVGTRAAWLGGKEVVEVEFDPELLPYAKLLSCAEQVPGRSTVFAHDAAQLAAARTVVGARAERVPGAASPAKAADRKYYLR
ncbi:MAG: hypothetical protein KDC87_14335, partial [Planctomycetes bacterium]|nr:hypothetical protein [Planctomycetota bacterium]